MLSYRFCYFFQNRHSAKLRRYASNFRISKYQLWENLTNFCLTIKYLLHSRPIFHFISVLPSISANKCQQFTPFSSFSIVEFKHVNVWSSFESFNGKHWYKENLDLDWLKSIQRELLFVPYLLQNLNAGDTNRKMHLVTWEIG